jgi:RNA polymerase sigma-70 factor (ECF subfamily)
MDELERAFRDAYGPAVATLGRVFGDITLAEDAVQDAFIAATRTWPTEGIPRNPAGWIVTTARNRAIDVVRREARGRELFQALATIESRTAPAPHPRRPCPRNPRSCVTTSSGSCSPAATRPSRWTTGLRSPCG